jgi:hypothetical protein
MKKIDNRILEEIARYNSINGYITEQEATLPPPPAEDPNALPPAPADPNVVPPAPAAPAGPQPVDLATDTDVEKIGEDGTTGSTEEMDITDLVNSQKKVEEKQEEYFENLFKHLDGLESKLGEMDGIMSKLNDLEMKIEKYREKTPQEKLELRTLDSGPFNQKLSQFFDDKEDDMEKSGKNEYVLTQNDVEDYSPNEIQKTFRNFGDETQPSSFQQLR